MKRGKSEQNRINEEKGEGEKVKEQERLRGRAR